MGQVSFRDGWKIYPGDVVAVRDANFTVEDGAFMVVVGPSGCGKSTTLRMVAGLEDVSRGTVSIDDRVVNDVAPKDRDIAMVFQNYALYPHMTVYDNMAFGLKMRKYAKDEIDKRVREAGEILGLTELLQRKPKALSGGQRQRVAVGRAIVRKPKVFLFDEPLSNLDAKLRVQMRSEISRLHKTLGATMLYVTHDQVEAMTMGTRITLMKDGVIQQIDAPLTLYKEPENQFVASFIGSPSMNLFPGRLVGSPRRFESDTFSCAIDRPDLQSLPERVTMGVRPENVRLVSPDAGGMRVVIDLIEPLGSEMYVHGRAGEHRVVARLGPDHPLRLGEEIALEPDPTRIHLFDGETGIALRPTPTSVEA
jgi:multiple sugar transport system ATP-binding protein